MHIFNKLDGLHLSIINPDLVRFQLINCDSLIQSYLYIYAARACTCVHACILNVYSIWSVPVVSLVPKYNLELNMSWELSMLAWIGKFARLWLIITLYMHACNYSPTAWIDRHVHLTCNKSCYKTLLCRLISQFNSITNFDFCMPESNVDMQFICFVYTSFALVKAAMAARRQRRGTSCAMHAYTYQLIHQYCRHKLISPISKLICLIL